AASGTKARSAFVFVPFPRLYYLQLGSSHEQYWPSGDAIMASAKVSLLQRQVVRVHRRLVLQTFLNLLAWCWAAAILLAAGWFLLQPYVIDAPPDWVRWTVAGGLVGASTLLAVVLGFVRAPSRLLAALSLDSAFGLKERVTT